MTGYRDIAAALRNDIKAGVYQPGQQIPPVRELTKQFGVAAMTVYHALQVLQQEAVVYSRHGTGTFVSSPLAAPPGLAAALREMHHSSILTGRCVECLKRWPCPTEKLVARHVVLAADPDPAD